MDTNPTTEQLQAQLTAKNAEATELQTKLTAETSAHAITKQEVATVKQELADANEIIDELNKKLDAAPKPVEHIVTLGVGANGKKFRVTLPKFNFEGKVYQREDVKSNSDLLKKLVELGAVVELVEAAK